MATYVAFLRGINVAGRTVTNDRLRELFGDLGFDEVRTFLSSGNVIFRTDEVAIPALEEHIESRLGDGLGDEVPTFVRTAEQVTAVGAHAPFADPPEGGTLHIGFLREDVDEPTKDKILGLAKGTDRVAFHGCELYWHVASRFMDSALSDPAVGRMLGNAWTVRTATTVRRIAASLLG